MRRGMWLRINAWVFSALLLALLAGLAWASAGLSQSWQWGGQLHSSLSPPTQQLLALLDEEITVYGFAPPGQLLHRHMDELLALYQAESAYFQASIINPETQIGRAHV